MVVKQTPVDGLEAVHEPGHTWGWRWRTPSGATVVSECTYPRKRVALAAGRQYVREHR